MKKFFFIPCILITLLLTLSHQSFAQMTSDIDETIEDTAQSALRETLRSEAILETLPDYGFGILKSIRNQSNYPASVRFEKTLHDSLPNGSIVRIKCLASGKYFTAKKVDNAFNMQVDGTDPNDKTTNFVISRRISPNLQDWIGLAPQTDPQKMLLIDETGGGIATLTASNFASEDDQPAHWQLTIEGDTGSIDDCSIKNRKTTGLLTTYAGQRTKILQAEERTVSVDTVLPDVYGITPAVGTLFAYFYQKDKPTAGADVSQQITTFYHNGKFSDQYSANEKRGALDLLHEGILPDPAPGCFKNFYLGFFDISTQAPVWASPGWTEETKFNIPGLPQPLVPCGEPTTVISQAPITAPTPAQFTCLATIDPNNVWGITINATFKWDSSDGILDEAKRISCSISSSTLMHWDGSTWQSIMPNVKHVATGSDGDVWIVDTSGIVSALNQATGVFEPTSSATDQLMAQVGVHNAKDAWAIGVDKAVYRYNGTEWKKNSPATTAGVVNISVAESNPLSDDGYVCAVDAAGTLYRYENKKWSRSPTPEVLIQAAITPNNTIWAVAKNFNLYFYDGKTWNKQSQQLSYVAPAGIKKKVNVKAAKTQTEKVIGLITTDATNKPLENYKAAHVAIEIVQAGLGGNLPAGQTINVSIPISKNPVVTGFAKTVLDDFSSSSQLNVAPLLGLGAAWPEQAFKTPNRGTVSFLARATDAGDVQVVLGPEISDKYSWKVAIGGAHNTKSSITQQIYQKGEPLESTVYEITADQNPLAAVTAGTFIPYWVTYDQGFIMAGMGSPGENIFMAQRIANPDTTITRAGFSSNTANVEYANIQFLPPVVMQKPSRIYFQSKKASPIAPSPQITWTQFPFRIANSGSLGCELMGQESVAIAFGTSKDQNNAHYLITLNDNDAQGNRGISLKKWLPAEKQYKDRTFFKTETYQDVELAADQWTKIWISYQEGLFIIGNGEIGENHLFAYKDLNEIQNIHTIGLANLGKQNAQLQNPTIAAPVYMSVEASPELYAATETSFDFSGNITVIIPFEYQFFQEEQSIAVADNISQKRYYPAGTPQQGALYNFMFTITEDGSPQMTLINQPDNPLLKNIQQAATTASAAADLERAKSTILTSEGARLQKLQSALGAVDKSQYDAETATASTVIGAGTATIQATSASKTLPIAAIGIGIGTAMTTAGIITAKMAESHLVDAAQKDYQGAEQASLEQKQALTSKSNAAYLDFQASNLQGSANFAFRSPSSYVFVDQPVHAALGSIQVPQEALDNKAKAAQLAEQLGTMVITDIASFKALLNTLQNIVYSINNFAVVSDVLKEQFFNGVTQLFQSYESLFANAPDTSTTNSIIILLFSAMNNCYLLDQDDKATRETWYTYANKLAQGLLTASATITLPVCYGEYIWFPVPFPQADQVTITLTIAAQSDAFIGFAKDPVRIRNTTLDFYEIVLGGWENTKAAIRLQSLGGSAMEFDGKAYPGALLNPYQEKTYQISINNGRITIVPSDGKAFGWKDPYPIKGIRWLGISCWDSPVTFKSITINPLISTPATTITAQKTNTKKIVKQTSSTTKTDVPPKPKATTKQKVTTVVKKTKPSTTTKKTSKNVPVTKKADSVVSIPAQGVQP